MSTNTKLSDRIAISAEKFFHSHVSECEPLQFLLTGKEKNANEYMAQLWRNWNALNDTWILLLENAIKKSNSLETKHALQQELDATRLFFKNRDNRFKGSYRSINDTLLSNLQQRNCWFMSQFFANIAVNGSFNEVLTVLYAWYWISYAIIKLRDHPNFIPNQYYDCWCTYDTGYTLELFKQMIDANACTVSLCEKKRLTKLSMKTLAFSHVCFNNDWQNSY